MLRLSATINGRQVHLDVEPDLLLIDLLRDELGLTGTKLSCGVQVCGACTVLVDGQPVSSCATLALDIDGLDVETIEGVRPAGALDPIQQSFCDAFALQCGFCTPGLVMTVKALLAAHPDPSDTQLHSYVAGNLCRCTGYETIAEAARLAVRRSSEVADGN